MELVALLSIAVLLAAGLMATFIRVADAAKKRQALRRSAARAAEVAEALGVIAEQDGEIPTTWTLRVGEGSFEATLVMGSPAIFSNPLDEVVDWMKLSTSGPVGFSEGARVRTPSRTYTQWRDGEPGEAPSLVTPRGVRLVVEPGKDGAPVDTAALAAWVDAFPAGIWLVTLSREACELRANTPATGDPVRCARELLELIRSAPPDDSRGGA